MSVALVPRRSSFIEIVERVGKVVRRVIGAPDYDSYLTHFRLAHPGEEPLPERDFIRRQMEGRAKPGARCC